MTRLGRWGKEPLVHFVVLGVLVFALHRWVAPPSPKRIVLSAAVVDGLRKDHVRRTGVPPTREEERGLIEQFVDNEVLYREALAMGLDRGDIIVRRRLVQKMEFLTEDTDRIVEPSEQELRAYRDAHADRYGVPEQFSLTHVFVSGDRHGAESQRIAAELRAQLDAGADPGRLGDPFVRGAEFKRHSVQEIAAIFGAAFADRLSTLPTGAWSAPIASSYGLHLVRVTERVPRRMPTVDEIRGTLLNEWRVQQRAAASRVALDRLRRQYDIRIERPAATLASR
ncbi:MAG TPA: peptidylprolyl isomerase [Candidatus Binatia bacterium]|nr:peptidylprolyl isomerase [Candidatus Binatia bacterium]